MKANLNSGTSRPKPYSTAMLSKSQKLISWLSNKDQMGYHQQYQGEMKSVMIMMTLVVPVESQMNKKESVIEWARARI